MLTLGIETSCDETSASIVQNGRNILSNVVSSQIKIHNKYFGVVPELASRAHLENINKVIELTYKQGKLSLYQTPKYISCISYTKGPGLAGSLLVGQITAQTLSFIYRVPLIDINHIEGHLYSALLLFKNLKPPFLSLIVSGGHTELIIVEDFGKYKYLGGTRDDAAGEAFDKVAKLLNLGYPGGPIIDKLSKYGNPQSILFPRPYLKGTWDFSFSGLKTAVVNFVRSKNLNLKNKTNIQNICASFQQAVVDTLIEKTLLAAKKYKIKKIVIGGGVAANSKLRNDFIRRGKKEKFQIFLPSIELCTDNAAMIACAGYYKFKKMGMPQNTIYKTDPSLKLQNW